MMSQNDRFINLLNGKRLELVFGDITKEQTDAIVNAANTNLAHDGGLAASIVQSGGLQIQEESDLWVTKNGPASHKKPAITSAGKLPCRYVIHVVGPIWGSGNEAEKLFDAIQSSLAKASEINLNSIAIPPISTGIFRYPVTDAAKVILKSVVEYIKCHPDTSLSLIKIVVIDLQTMDKFVTVFDQLFSQPKDSIKSR